MPQVVVLADPPRDGLVLPSVPATSGLSASHATRLYTAVLRDAVVAAEDSGGDLLVNYRPDGSLPEAHRREDDDVESVLRDALAVALEEPDEARFEEQVGSSRSARVGNTVTHLLEEEGASSVVVVDPRAPTIGRTGIDELAMKLRRSEVVVAPSTRGRVAAVGFSEVLDFEGVLAAPSLTRLTDRAVDARLDVDYAAFEPLVETGGDVVSLVAGVRARATAGRYCPPFTEAAVEDLELGLAVEDDRVEAVTGTDSS